MIFSSIIGDYFRWHYGKAFGELFHVWLNFLWFVIHFFSIPELTTSLIAPWRRMTEERKKGFNFEDLASFVVINLLSRIIGAIMRSAVIICGLGCLVIVIIIGVVVMVLWVFAPIISLGTLLIGASLILSNFIL